MTFNPKEKPVTDATRKKWALRYRALLDEGRTKKEAMFMVREEMKAANPKMPRSRRQIYTWCAKFKIKIR